VILRVDRMGLTFVPVTLIATSGIPTDDAGLASGSTTPRSRSGRARARDLSTFAVSKTNDTLSGLGRPPQPADQAQALVDGFHVAYIGSAALVAVAAVLLAVLLRRATSSRSARVEAAPVAGLTARATGRRIRVALERADDLGRDPAAVEVARLRRHALVVDEAGVHPAGIERDGVADRLEGLDRVVIRPRAACDLTSAARTS
jgi:hypothetical protein